MSVRVRYVVGALLLHASMAPAPISALEKHLSRAPEVDSPDWSASATTTIRYYNTCTGWTWTWSGWDAGDRMGFCFDVGGSGGLLSETSMYIEGDTWYCGYGFTGTISIRDGCDCSAGVVAVQPWCPLFDGLGWQTTAWGGVPVPPTFQLRIDWAVPTGWLGNPNGLVSDHPAAGATGPPACGTCFPSSRVVRSRYFDSLGTYCPSGVALDDGVCHAEFLVEASLQGAVGLQEESWGGIKTLYR